MKRATVYKMFKGYNADGKRLETKVIVEKDKDGYKITELNIYGVPKRLGYTIGVPTNRAIEKIAGGRLVRRFIEEL